VGGGQAVPEQVAGLADAADARGVLAPDLVAGGGQAAGGTVGDVDRAVVGPGLVLVGHPDGQVGASAAVEVGGGQAVPEQVAGLADAADARAVLAPDLVAGGGQAA